MILGIADLSQLFDTWAKLTYSKILSVDQRGILTLEFVIDSTKQGKRLLEAIRKITIEKVPVGTVSFLSHYEGKSQYRIYRVEFIDAAIQDEKPDDYTEKLFHYVEKLKEVIEEAAHHGTEKSKTV